MDFGVNYDTTKGTEELPVGKRGPPLGRTAGAPDLTGFKLPHLGKSFLPLPFHAWEKPLSHRGE